ncbi:cmgb11 [Campylobacter helveticus]|nr:hypothetical protein [Campylobacter helveticus]SUW87776.1 cmgb11 [Campylobacter helveticus]
MSISLQKYASSFFGKYLNDPLINEFVTTERTKFGFLNANGEWESEDTKLDFDGAEAFSQQVQVIKKTKLISQSLFFLVF